MEDKQKCMTVMPKALSKPKARPSMAVERPRMNVEAGMCTGTVATTPQEIDSIVLEKWGKTCEGNVRDYKHHLGVFDEKLDEHISEVENTGCSR